MTDQSPAQFSDLGLPKSLLDTITAIGYESPSPIQAQTIPVLLEGHDLIGQAQTGTGKTAAFALPILAQLDTSRRETQALVLAPTRELAIQVAEACQTYARHMPGFHVVPIYGGAAYGTQLKQLRTGAQLVVGTPGRVMDHIRRGSLKLDTLKTLVLDEADEMLRMGFIDDVKWILEQTPSERQVALFSATMPKEIQAVANAHLSDPKTIKIQNKTATAAAINQRYWPVAGLHKLDALTRILEAEPVDGAVVFVRTKIATTELAEKLSARGFSAEALNGDMAQAQREKTIDRMRQGKLDLLIATDVAARGIDIPRISHVINYDIPFDTEAYVHRIGRTGRAGRAGEAILFVANRERRMLKAIERATKQPIAVMNLPSEKDINAYRVARFKKQIEETLASANLDLYRKLVEELQEDTGAPALEIAAALAHLKQGDTALLLQERAPRERKSVEDTSERRPKRAEGKQSRPFDPNLTEAQPLKDHPDVEMVRYRIDVGYEHGVKPGNIVGAIANELDLDSAYIGHIQIYDDCTTVDLPEGMPKDLFQHLKKVRVCQRPLGIIPVADYRGDKPLAKKPGKPKAGRGKGPEQQGKAKGHFKKRDGGS